jgi:hypothetical protein
VSLLQRLASWSTLRLWMKSGYYVPEPSRARQLWSSLTAEQRERILATCRTFAKSGITLEEAQARILNAVRPRARKK